MDERSGDLQSQVSQLFERIAENRSDHRAILHRLEELEMGHKRLGGVLMSLGRQADAIEALNQKIDRLNESLSSVSGRVTQIEREPGERWKKIGFELIKYIVLAAAGAAIGFLMK